MIARPAVCATALGVVIVLGAPAQAAPSVSRDYAAPYGSSSAQMTQHCSSGAGCFVASIANARGGHAASTVRYSRTVAAGGEERVEGEPSFRQVVQLPKGVTAATVTATWHITSAAAEAASTRGFLHAGSLLLAQVLCDGSCVAPLVATQVTLACSEERVTTCISTPGTDDTHAKDVDLVVTATVRDLAKPSFTFWTEGLSYVDAGPVCGLTTSVTDPVPATDDCSTTVDALHAGNGSSRLDATLVGFHVAAS